MNNITNDNIDLTLIDDKNTLDCLDALPAKRIINTQDELRSDLMTFLSSQFDSISKEDNLKNLVEREIAKNIMIHEFDANQLIALYSELSKSKTQHLNAVTDIFKPGNNATPLLCMPVQNSNAEIDVSEKEKQDLLKMQSLLNIINSQEK